MIAMSNPRFSASSPAPNSTNVGSWKKVFLVFIFCAATEIASSAQTLGTLANFNGPNGADPEAPLVQATDGNFYGTTLYGGTGIGPCTGQESGCGIVFKITPAGTLTTLYDFCSQTDCADGGLPNAGLVQGADGNLYGTTTAGGSFNGGTAFKITPTGMMTTLYAFCSQSNCTDGVDSTGGLVQGTDGNFYGTTYGGGANGLGDGTVFKMTPAGTLTTLYSFCSQSNCTDGQGPIGGLVQGTDGNFYGTTSEGGSFEAGTAFKITPSGAFTTLHSFNPEAGGWFPYDGLVQATDGNFYGTTFFGGVYQAGTVFKITPGGVLTTLHSCGTDGSAPRSVLSKPRMGSSMEQH